MSDQLQTMKNEEKLNKKTEEETEITVGKEKEVRE